ncbi:MAG TPA: hypothetical protein VL992_08290 [Tepidisphaeraceae bacterium]|nr:hypothetical protein [Tepidisphaeraceae bacterium]
MKRLLSRLLHCEHAGEVLEYALVLSLIVVAGIATIANVGGKLLALYSSLNSSN